MAHKVEEFLDALRGDKIEPGLVLNEDDSSYTIITEIYTSGNCGNLAVMLSLAFNGTPYVLDHLNHIVTEIEGRLYDITGDVTLQYKTEQKTKTTWLAIQRGVYDMFNSYSFVVRGPSF